MNNETKDLTGRLFRNNEKNTPKSPDYGGTITINGTEFRLSGWIKDGPKGKFLSLAAQPKQSARGRDADMPF